MLHHNHETTIVNEKQSEDCTERETEDDIACTFGLSSEENGKRKSKVVATKI